jgi:hypothetical protein
MDPDISEDDDICIFWGIAIISEGENGIFLKSVDICAPFFFHTSAQHPVACAIEVTINTVYATLFIYYPLLEDVLNLCSTLQDILWHIDPVLGNDH